MLHEESWGNPVDDGAIVNLSTDDAAVMQQPGCLHRTVALSLHSHTSHLLVWSV